MPRMFDILKHHALNEESGMLAKEGQGRGPGSKNKMPHGKENKDPSGPESFSLVSRKLISAVKNCGVDNAEKSKEVYDAAVMVVNDLLKKVRAGEGISSSLDAIHSVSDDIFNQLLLGDSLLSNTCVMRNGEYYLPYHIVNSLVLSSAIGINMGFNKSRLSHLGLAAIFSDLELDSLREVIDQARRLTADEYRAISSHVQKALRLTEGLACVSDAVKESIEMHHERINGKGYPRGLAWEEINPYAKIIGLADTYEALVNHRPYRRAMNAHDAVKHILTSLKDYFDPDVLRVFLNKMSIYPIGSIVKLDTHELAKVIGVKPGSPLRPVVMVIQDPDGEPARERNIIDLSKENLPAIVGPA